MNNSCLNPPSQEDSKSISSDQLSTEIPPKLGAAQLKLRQLVKKTPIPSLKASSSPNQTLQNPSKHTVEASVWETCSPTVSILNPFSPMTSTKAASPKVYLKASSMSCAKGPAQQLFLDLGDNSREEIEQSKSKSASPVEDMGAEDFSKNGNIGLGMSAQGNGLNTQNYKNYLLFQPSNMRYKDGRMERINSFTDEDDDYSDNNLSLEAKPKPGRPVGLKESYSMSPENQEKIENSKRTAKKLVKTGMNNTVTSWQKPHRHKKAESLKCSFVEVSANESLIKKVDNKQVRPIESVVVLVASTKNKKGPNEKVSLDKSKIKTPAQSPDRRANPNSQTAGKLMKASSKVLKATIDLGLGRKSSLPASKEGANNSKKGTGSGVKRPGLNTSSKFFSRKESLDKITDANSKEVEINKADGSPSSVMQRLKKSLHANITRSMSSYASPSSAKNLVKMPENTAGIDVEKSDVTLNQITPSTAQDTTNKRLSRKETLEENIQKASQAKVKRLMRAKSQGGSVLIEEASVEVGRNEKMSKVRSKAKAMAMKKMKDKGSREALRSVDYKETDKKTGIKSKKTRELSVDMEENSKNMIVSDNGTGTTQILCQVLERTNKLLSIYQEREKNWQSERQELLGQIVKLKKKESL